MAKSCMDMLAIAPRNEIFKGVAPCMKIFAGVIKILLRTKKNGVHSRVHTLLLLGTIRIVSLLREASMIIEKLQVHPSRKVMTSKDVFTFNYYYFCYLFIFCRNNRATHELFQNSYPSELVLIEAVEDHSGGVAEKISMIRKGKHALYEVEELTFLTTPTTCSSFKTKKRRKKTMLLLF